MWFVANFAIVFLPCGTRPKRLIRSVSSPQSSKYGWRIDQGVAGLAAQQHQELVGVGESVPCLPAQRAGGHLGAPGFFSQPEFNNDPSGQGADELAICQNCAYDFCQVAVLGFSSHGVGRVSNSARARRGRARFRRRWRRRLSVSFTRVCQGSLRQQYQTIWALSLAAFSEQISASLHSCRAMESCWFLGR